MEGSESLYSPQINQWSLYVLYWVSSVAQTRQDIEKRVSASLKEIENKVFLSKIWHLNFLYLSFAKFTIFAIRFKNKSCFIIFIDVWPLCYQWCTVTFLF